MHNIVLDLCGGSGAWSQPYKNAKYDVILLTLPEYDVRNFHIAHYPQGSPRIIFDSAEFPLYVDIDEIVGILAAPPCTEFSIANAVPYSERDLVFAMSVVQACMQIVWRISEYSKLDFWALENPRGLLRRFLGNPLFTFEQWQYGNLGMKATDIWGWFNKPKPTVTVQPSDVVPLEKVKYADIIKTNPQAFAHITGREQRRSAARAITPSGFANAFFKANNPLHLSAQMKLTGGA